MSDYIERRKKSRNEFLSMLFTELERRAALFVHDHPETDIERFVAKDSIISSVIMLAIAVYFTATIVA